MVSTSGSTACICVWSTWLNRVAASVLLAFAKVLTVWPDTLCLLLEICGNSVNSTPALHNSFRRNLLSNMSTCTA